MNILLFAAAILHNRPAWYTNDDFRMMTIVSGAYTGTPSADIVFMRYPIGLFLSALYRITTAVPWYGLFTMACMFLPSCIFGYYILKTAGRKHHFLLGILLYILLFGLFIQKYVCLPQFTLTSAFMGAGASCVEASDAGGFLCSAVVFGSFKGFLPAFTGALPDSASEDLHEARGMEKTLTLGSFGSSVVCSGDCYRLGGMEPGGVSGIQGL